MVAFPLCACCCIQTRGCNLAVFPAQLRNVDDGLRPVRCLFTTTKKLMMQLHWLGKSGDLILLPPNVIVHFDAPYIFTNFEYITFLEKKMRTLWWGGVSSRSEWMVAVRHQHQYRQTMHTRIKMGSLPGFSCTNLYISILSCTCYLSLDLTPQGRRVLEMTTWHCMEEWRAVLRKETVWE